jgi:TldD protein
MWEFLNLDEKLIEQGIEIASKLGASYIAVKLSDMKTLDYSAQNDRTRMTVERTPGCHVRVICNGAWGFAGSADVDALTIKTLAYQAVKLAKANATIRKVPVKLASNKAVQATYDTHIHKDPFKIPPEEIFDLLKSSVKIAKEQSNLIKSSSASVIATVEHRMLGTSEGAMINQKLIRTSAGLTATAENMGMIQSSGLGQNFATKGYEWVESRKLPEAAVTEGKTAAELAKAQRCPDAVTTIIIEDHMLALQIHETLGHPSELDRVLNTEVDFVGPIGESFFSPSAIGKMWFGSNLVNIVADATIDGGQGTFGFDDEAVPAKKNYLIKEGIFVGFQSSRETAAEIDLPESSGQYLSTYGFDQPVVRMTNINLLPGDWTRQELIEDTKEGILMSDYRTEIFDQRRTTFGFGAQKAWRIKNGELTQILRDPTYYGVTNPFWRTCDGISKDNWYSYGGGCGKCRPGQSGRVGHFCSSARFRNVHVGGGGVNE